MFVNINDVQVALADTRIPLVEVAQGDGDGEAELELDDDPAHATCLDAGRVPVVVTVSQARMQLGRLMSWICCFHTSPVANTIFASYGRRGQATLTEQGVGSAPGRRQGTCSVNFQVPVSLVRAHAAGTAWCGRRAYCMRSFALPAG